jgi:RNA polymerase sigma-70 factor (ECF subfamily)
VRLPVSHADAALVAALRAGRSEASKELFDRYAEHVQRVLVRVLGPDAELSDLLHDVFVAAFSSLDKLSDPNALRAWLTKIAVFTARARIRRRVRWRFIRLWPMDELSEIPGTSSSPELSEELRCTYRILHRMPPDERIAFALRFIDGMELTEVATACNVSLATIKRRLQRAQARFLEAARAEPVLVEWVGEQA